MQGWLSPKLYAACLVVGFVLVALGCAAVPADPVLEDAWDRVEVHIMPRPMAKLLTKSGNGVVVILPLLAVLLAPRGRRARLLGAIALAAVTAALATHCMKCLVGRARPHAFAEANVFVPLSPDSAFHSLPSGHASNAAVVAFFLWLIMPRGGALWFSWALAVGLSRVALDRHFFGDIICGFGIGLIACAIAVRTAGLLRRQRARRREQTRTAGQRRAAARPGVAAAPVLPALQQTWPAGPAGMLGSLRLPAARQLLLVPAEHLAGCT